LFVAKKIKIHFFELPRMAEYQDFGYFGVTGYSSSTVKKAARVHVGMWQLAM
jgi:hypothetical protein